MTGFVLAGCHVVTMDAGRAEHAAGYVAVTGNQIAAAGQGAVPGEFSRARVIDAAGCLATPGLINTHHHLYQSATRGQAVDATLFGWLTELYPVWARIDAQIVQEPPPRRSAGWPGPAARPAPTPLRVPARRRRRARGDDRRGPGGRAAVPPDQGLDGPGRHVRRPAARRGRRGPGHDPGGDSRGHRRLPDPRLARCCGSGIAPCSPFSVTGDLMRAAAGLARQRGVRLHTHLAETTDEAEFCAARFGCTPAEYLDSLDWLAADVWLAHGIHLDDAAIARLAATGTGVAHCPSSNARLGAGICRTADLIAAGVPVGLGVDGSASNEEASLIGEVRQAVLMARTAGGPEALTVRQALELGTLGGARLIGREHELGSLEPGKLADIALWRLDGLQHANIADPVAALVLGGRPPLELLVVNGEIVVERDQVVMVDEHAAAAAAVRAAGTLLRAP